MEVIDGDHDAEAILYILVGSRVFGKGLTPNLVATASIHLNRSFGSSVPQWNIMRTC